MKEISESKALRILERIRTVRGEAGKIVDRWEYEAEDEVDLVNAYVE